MPPIPKIKYWVPLFWEKKCKTTRCNVFGILQIQETSYSGGEGEKYSFNYFTNCK